MKSVQSPDAEQEALLATRATAMAADESTSDHSIPPQQGLLLGTLAAHAGLPRKPLLGNQTAEVSTFPALSKNAHVTPLFQTSVFDFDSISSGLEQVVGQGAYGYGRMGLPNAHELGAAVAVLEGGEAGVATSSGDATWHSLQERC